MTIEIVTKLLRSTSYNRRRIISISKVLGKGELPDAYLKSPKEVFFGEIVDNKIQRLCYSNGKPLLSSDVTYNENWFQEVLTYLRKAGKNLHQINENSSSDEIFYI